MTKYYLIRTDAYNEVIATEGKRAYSCAYDCNGIDVNSGVDLYPEDPEVTGCSEETAYKKLLKKFREEYKKLDLYNMDDIIQDYGADDIFAFDEEDFEIVGLVAEVE